MGFIAPDFDFVSAGETERDEPFSLKTGVGNQISGDDPAAYSHGLSP